MLQLLPYNLADASVGRQTGNTFPAGLAQRAPEFPSVVRAARLVADEGLVRE